MNVANDSMLDSNHNIKIHNVATNGDGTITYTKKGYGEITTDRPLGAIRLEQALDEIDMSQQDLALRIGVLQPSISRIISGKTKRSRHLTDIAKVLNKSVSWLAGQEEDEKSSADLNGSELIIDGHKFFLIYAYEPEDDIETITKGDSFIIVSCHCVPEQTKVSDVRYLTHIDRAMSPEIKPNSAIVFDTADKKIVNGDIYVIQVMNNIVARFLFMQPNGQVLIRSKDADFPDFSVDPDNGDMKILGRVFMSKNQH